MKAYGTFEVELSPLEYSHPSPGHLQLGRLSIHKNFDGDLAGSSRGEMLSARSSHPGKAGYVALENVEGEIKGKKGSFALQHFGVMNGESNRLILEVVPGSGSGELEGINGTMNLEQKDGIHHYSFEYTL